MSNTATVSTPLEYRLTKATKIDFSAASFFRGVVATVDAYLYAPYTKWWVCLNADEFRNFQVWLEDASPGVVFPLPDGGPPHRFELSPTGDTVLYTMRVDFMQALLRVVIPLEMLKAALADCNVVQ